MNRKKPKKLIKIFTLVLVYGVILGLTFQVLMLKVSGGTIKVIGYKLMIVLSGSMEPEIKTGSLIAIRPIENEKKFRIGDVITYKTDNDENLLITHRIIDVQKSGKIIKYIAKGDSNKTEDPFPVTSGNIVGKYTGFTIPFAGKVLAFIQSKAGAVYLLIVPGIFMSLMTVFNFWKRSLHSMRRTV